MQPSASHYRLSHSEDERHVKPVDVSGTPAAPVPQVSGGNLGQRSRELIDLLRRIEGARADAHRAVRERADGAMDVRRAVQTRTDGDVERLIEDAAQLGRRQRVAAEAERGDAVG